MLQEKCGQSIRTAKLELTGKIKVMTVTAGSSSPKGEKEWKMLSIFTVNYAKQSFIILFEAPYTKPPKDKFLLRI